MTPSWHAVGTILARGWHHAWHYRWDLCPGLGALVGKLARWWHVLGTIVARGWHHRGTLLGIIIWIFAQDLGHPRATWHVGGTYLAPSWHAAWDLCPGLGAPAGNMARWWHVLGTIMARCLGSLPGTWGTRGQHGTIVARSWHADGTYLAQSWHALGTLVARTWHHRGTLLACCLAHSLGSLPGTWVTRGQHGTLVARIGAPAGNMAR